MVAHSRGVGYESSLARERTHESELSTLDEYPVLLGGARSVDGRSLSFVRIVQSWSPCGYSNGAPFLCLCHRHAGTDGYGVL